MQLIGISQKLINFLPFYTVENVWRKRIEARSIRFIYKIHERSKVERNQANPYDKIEKWEKAKITTWRHIVVEEEGWLTPLNL